MLKLYQQLLDLHFFLIFFWYEESGLAMPGSAQVYSWICFQRSLQEMFREETWWVCLQGKQPNFCTNFVAFYPYTLD